MGNDRMEGAQQAGATRESVLELIASEYGVDPEYPWERYPTSCVFRLAGAGSKWFAALLDAPGASVGRPEDGRVFVLNVKSEPALIDGLVHEEGFARAYHMSKRHWVSVILDGKVELERVADLIAISRDLVR